MSYFQSENYYKLISELNSFKISKLDETKLIVISVGSENKLKRKLTGRNLIIDPDYNSLYATLKHLDVKKLNSLNKSAIYSEFRLHRILPVEIKNFLKENFLTEEYYNIIVNTDKSEKDLFASLSSSKKRQVNSSLKKGLKVEIASKAEDIKDFYSILKEHYIKKVRKPLYPLELFLNFHKNNENGYIFIAKYKDNVIGGMVAPVFNNEIIYEWYIAAMDQEYKAEGVYPSVLLTWEVIRFASLNGFRNFDFMGAGPVGKEYGVRRFKLQFGGELLKTLRIKIIHKPALYKLGKLAIDFGLGGKF